MTKDIDEQSDDETHRVRSGRALGIGASVPAELRCVTSSDVDVFANWKFSEPHTTGILRRLSQVGMISC